MGKAEPSDQDLLERIRAGDDSSYGILFQRYKHLLSDYAKRWLPVAVRRRVSSSDVVQEAQLVAFQRIGTFEDRGDGSLRNWLIRIVELKVREAVRRHMGTAKRSAGNEVTRGMRANTGEFRGNGRSPVSLAANAELREQIERALEELRPDYASILRLTRQDHLSLAEAAERMGKSRDAVKKLHGRAMVCFAEALAKIRGNGDG